MIIIDRIDTFIISELQKVPNLYNICINDLENRPNFVKILPPQQASSPDLKKGGAFLKE